MVIKHGHSAAELVPNVGEVVDDGIVIKRNLSDRRKNGGGWMNLLWCGCCASLLWRTQSFRWRSTVENA